MTVSQNKCMWFPPGLANDRCVTKYRVFGEEKSALALQRSGGQFPLGSVMLKMGALMFLHFGAKDTSKDTWYRGRNSLQAYKQGGPIVSADISLS